MRNPPPDCVKLRTPKQKFRLPIPFESQEPQPGATMGFIFLRGRAAVVRFLVLLWTRSALSRPDGVGWSDNQVSSGECKKT